MPEFNDINVELDPVNDSFDVFEEEQKPDTVEVKEPAHTPEVIEVEETVPGSDAKFVQFTEDKPEQEAKDVQKESDWEHDQEPSKFLAYIKDKMTKIPRHSGNTVPGCERAISYLKALENEASKAMRSDFDGKIDEGELDKVRKDIDDMVFRLENHIERLQKNAAEQRVKFISQGECKSYNSVAPMWHDQSTGELVCMNCENKHGGLSKSAGTAVVNVYMTPWERSVIATIINSVVSAGKNLEESFDHMDKKYKFSDREKLAFVQLLSDHGYPVRLDRGRLGEKPELGEEFEWITNYPA